MVQKINVYYSPAGEDRTLHLYLPDDYYYTDERYPVLYMFDGHNLFFDWDATFGKSLGMKEFLDHWNKKMIVVGIACSYWDNVRTEEYCPYHIYTDQYGHTYGRGGETMDWVVDHLKPMIDSRYRTYPFREATAIGGYSLGGMMALFAAVRYNRWFSKAACLSPTVLPAMESFKEEIQGSTLSPDTRIFLSWGTAEETGWSNDDIGRCIVYLEQRLQEKGAQTYLLCQQGGRHEEASWQQQIGTFMHFLWF
jgi:predicted alpha/beta superfamily hydrolase